MKVWFVAYCHFGNRVVHNVLTHLHPIVWAQKEDTPVSIHWWRQLTQEDLETLQHNCPRLLDDLGPSDCVYL